MQGPPHETPVSVSWGKEEILVQDLEPLFFFSTLGFQVSVVAFFPPFQ